MQYLDKLKNHFYEMADSFSGLRISGKDAERFLNGQLSNDVTKLNRNEFQLQARLDRSGRLKAFFYLLKDGDSFLALVPHKLSTFLKEDLEKFIIMDDVEIETNILSLKLIFSPVENLDSILDPDGIKKSFRGSIGFLPCFLCEVTIPRSWKTLEKETLEELLLLRGEPVENLTAPIDTLVTDTVVNLTGVSLSKGCFLGQETVSKIETRRGGAKFPMLLHVLREVEVSPGMDLFVGEEKAGRVLKSLNQEDSKFILATINRKFRVEKRIFKFCAGDVSFDGTVQSLPLGGEFNLDDFLDQKFMEAVHLFQNEKVEEAMKLFNEIIDINPKHEDALESLGVILGRLERFEEGMALMDKVLEANPDSVMAHTNKSLFLMRLGKIEEAEEEKAQATVKSFSQFGKEAQAKKEKEEAEKQKLAEIERKMSMFSQVLEIDPEDELANYGLADVYFVKDTPEKSIPLLEKVLKINPKYSVAYLLMGKCFIKLKQNEKAKSIFEEGIKIASAQGDMMPANEMQAKLSSL